MESIKNKDILLTLALGLFYCILYDYTYANFIAIDFAYDGHRYINSSVFNYLTYFLFATLPLVFYKGLICVSAAYSIFAYLFMYVPTLHTMFFQYEISSLILSYIVVFVISMIAFFKTDKIYYNNKGKANWSFKWFEVISYLIILIVMLLNISNVHWVNFLTDSSSLYEYREDLEFGGGTIGTYLFCWARNVLVPILLVFYITKKQYIRSVIVFGVYILFYMIDMQKNTIILPFVTVLLYKLLQVNPKRVFKYFHTLIFICMGLVSGLCLCIKDINEIGFGIASIYFYRVQCIAGIQIRRYIDFFDFDNHQYTYYSHISIINELLNNYPYRESLGYTVSYGDGNSNASVWAMAGIAAAGPLGCVLVSIAFIVVKKYISKYCDNENLMYYLIIILPSVSYFTNVSLFTSLFTGGILLIIVLFKYLNFKY